MTAFNHSDAAESIPSATARDGAKRVREPLQYRLLDFGRGRKWECLGDYVIDRPCPAADGIRPQQTDRPVDAKFDRKTGLWHFQTPWPNDTVADFGSLLMPIRPTPFGHVGVFPEQQSNWKWLRNVAGVIEDCNDADPVMGLNLFGYTGASTIALAQAGLHMAHVDAARPNVEATRMAAQLNGLADHPIRYLVDDAAKFVAREIRRQRKYHCIVLDPPAYGHGPKGNTWRLQRDLWPLLSQCLNLLTQSGFLLITGHTEGIGTPEIRRFFDDVARGTKGQKSQFDLQSGRMTQQDPAGRSLDAGFYVRVRRLGNSS